MFSVSVALQLPSCPSPQPDHDLFSSVTLPACPDMTLGLCCSLSPPPLYIQLIAGLICYSCGRIVARFCLHLHLQVSWVFAEVEIAKCHVSA